MGRRTKIVLGVVVGAPVLVVLLGVLVLPRLDLAGFAATRLRAALGRNVEIGSLHVTPGARIRLALRDAKLANVDGGSRPAMVEIGRVDATLDLLPLLRGVIVLREAEAEGVTIFLERTADRRANWRFGPARGGAAPSDRSGLPMVHDVRLLHSEVVFRTTGGAELRTALEEAALTAAAVDAPASLRARGSYNDVPIALEAALGSIAALRDASTPFPVTLRATAEGTSLLFEGTATDPLNVDGADGQMTAAIASPTAILAMAGVTGGPTVPAEFAGRFRRNGDDWRLTDTVGTLDGAAFTAALLELVEGAAGRPDAVTARIDVARLDLDRVLASPADPEAAARRDAAVPFVVPAAPDPLIQVEVAAGEFSHARLTGTEARVRAEVAPSSITLEGRFITSFGARVTGSGRMLPAGDGARLDAELTLREADLDAMRRYFGAHALPLSGHADLDLVVSAEGTTFGAAEHGARISAVVAMTGGSIAREVIEMASTDLRTLFRTPRGHTAVSCLLAAIDVRAGAGEAAPLRIRAGTGTIAGIATFDLNRRQIDLVIGSERDTTHFFALDVPVRVKGSFADPDIAPAQWSREGRARLEHGGTARLPEALERLARRSPCFAGAGIRR